MILLNSIFLIFSTVMFIVFVIASIHEREPRAAFLAAAALPVNGALWCAFIFLPHLPWIPTANLAVVITIGLFLLVSVVKYFPSAEERDLSAIEKYDERDMMFARNELQHHPHLAERYYADHPELRESDEKIHRKPELGEPGHTYYDPYRSPFFKAAFAYLKRTKNVATGEAAQEKKAVDPETVTRVIKEMARSYGACDVGITRVEPYHIYSHYGRKAGKWGEAVNQPHRNAVAIVVPMEVDRMKHAPGLPVVLEAARLYVESAKIAHIVGEYIRGMGYDAHSHTDGDYEVLCVPMAVDAGVGILSRMGILMHPVYGPCIRISVVTTDLELVPSPKTPYVRSMDAFCDICKKCADNCPTQSITREHESVSRGFRHWTIDQDKCFAFWKNIGTDCGFCIRVCPYTKPDTFIHKLVRWYISRNPINQRIALFMDDLFYGRNIPIPKT